MVKLDFYGTGKDDRFIKSMQNFPPLMASPDKSSSLEQRNELDKNFKAESKRQHDNNIYIDNFKQNNYNYSSKKKYFQSHYDSLKQKSQTYDIKKQQSLNSPFHSSSLKLFNSKTYSESQRNIQANQTNLSTRVQSLNGTRNSNNNNNNFNGQISNQASPSQSTSNISNINGSIERDHFYVTRPLLRINKDFIEKPLIKNVQVVSEDLPSWCQSTNKYYTPENIDKTKKLKIVIKKNQDIFSNDIKTYPNNFKFFCEPPSEGTLPAFIINIIYDEKNNFFSIRQIAYKIFLLPKNLYLAKKELMFGKLRIRWDEDTKKQKYEPRLPLKIGHDNENPYIKKLEIKRNQSLHEFKKIGEADHFKLENRDKPVQLKIGRGLPETINLIKFYMV
ncbi:hypothetical protein ABPG72_016129 [Tetrahymena utriculariae]